MTSAEACAPNDKPPGPDELDDLDRIRRDSSRILAFTAVILSVLVLLLVIGGGITFYRIIHEITSGRAAACVFYEDIGGLQVIASGPQKTGAIGVKLVADARIEYLERGCTPALPAPSLQLVQLSHEYNISLTQLPGH